MTTTSKAPFHVLFLPGGTTTRDSKSGQGQASSFTTRDDYLTRRYGFWKKKASNQKLATSLTEYPVNNQVLDEVGDELTVLRRMATPLELALAGCCQRLSPEDCQFASAHKTTPRSRLHRKIRPSNYDADTDEEEEESSNIKVEEEPDQLTLPGSGILRRGKECHFLSLLCMHCTANALGHRALALAILQRTIDWEKTACSSENVIVEQSHVITHLLEAGGMKLLARWLVDSFTVAPSSKGIPSPTGSLLLPILILLKSIPFNKDVVVSSHIHKTIKRLKKAIDTLVDGLEDASALKHKHPITGGLPVGDVLFALDDLMSSWKQAAAAEMKADKKPDVKSQPSSFDSLQKELQSRFDNLATLQNEGGAPPEWLPESISPIISGKSNLLAMHANSFKAVSINEGAPPDTQTQQNTSRGTNTNWYDPIKKEPTEQTRTWEKLMSRKRKEHVSFGRKSPTQFQKLNNNETQKKISWADRPLIRSAIPAPLAEVRVFEKDVFDDGVDEMPQHNHDINSSDQNEFASNTAAVKEEETADAELEDLCEDPDIADMF
jgi:hypothetical protein